MWLSTGLVFFFIVREFFVMFPKRARDGPISDLLTDAALLESSALTTPTMAKLMGELKALGFIDKVPLTYEEGLKIILQLLNR